jgi:hypothetical protein
MGRNQKVNMDVDYLRLASHLASDAFLAIRCLSSEDRFSARRFPPILPPLARLGAIEGVSSISPVAIFATIIAAPITSAGLFSPRGPLGITSPRAKGRL